MSKPRRYEPGDRVSTTLRIPRTLLDRLDAEASARVVGRTLLVERFIRDGLDRLEPVVDS